MRTKGDILQQVVEMGIEGHRSGMVPDIAYMIMIELFIDIRDIFKGALDYYNSEPDDSEGSF